MKIRLISIGLLTSLLSAAPATRGENPKPEEAIQAMVNAEKKFYQTGQEKGTRAAFLAFLADDSIVFRQGPVKGKESWEKRPETGLDLIWEPTFAAMARSGNLGYTTGPAKWRATKKDEKFSGYGQFISIWKKQKDGSWKVAVDCGIENPEPTEKPGPLQTLVLPDRPVSTPNAEGRSKTTEMRQKFEEVAKNSIVEATLEIASDQIHVYRDGSFPAVGKAAAKTLLTAKAGKTSFEPIGGDASYSEDLAYSYGKYSLTGSDGIESGSYLHIWQIEGDTCKLVLDWQKPQPKEK